MRLDHPRTCGGQTIYVIARVSNDDVFSPFTGTRRVVLPQSMMRSRLLLKNTHDIARSVQYVFVLCDAELTSNTYLSSSPSCVQERAMWTVARFFTEAVITPHTCRS